MATNYQRGRAFEYRTRDQLLKRGAIYVMRAAQSKGKADLAAFFPYDHGARCGEQWLVQCKHSIHGGGRLPAGEASDLTTLANLVGALPVFARPGKNGRGVEFINLYTGDPIG